MTPVAVSVVMAARNAERFVGEAIASVLAQTFTDFELLVVDDESTDRTAEIVRGFGDARVRYIPAGTHLGLPGALNLGMSHATGEFIARHDHDDVSDPQRFERQVAYLRSRPGVALVGTRAWLIDEAGRQIGSLDRCLDPVSVRWYHLFDNAFVHSSVMFRRSVVWQELGGYDASLPSSEDYELWARVLEHHSGANLPDRLVSYRTVSGSKMAADEAAWEQGPFPDTQRRLVRRGIERMFDGLLNEEELRLLGGFALGLNAEDSDRFLDAFFRLCSAYERRCPAATRSTDFQQTLAAQVDAVAARLRPLSRRGAIHLYRRALKARPALALAMRWRRVAGRVATGAAGRGALTRLRRRKASLTRP